MSNSTPKLNIAVIGGGINGLCSAWQLALEGHKVTLFERDRLMEKTSMSSSKLLHGGLRYLEHLEIGLVREALKERQWWLDNAPGLTRRLPILYPIYKNSRSRWQIKIGMILYDLLAGKKGIGRHRWLSRKQVKRSSPHLSQKNLKGAYLFFDGQMDDKALGLWVADQCRDLGVEIKEHSPVDKIDLDGHLESNDQNYNYDRLVNVSGPWSVRLLEDSDLNLRQSLDLVRGSHLLLPDISKFGHLLEVPDEDRIVFVLPFKEETLLGTTEVKQQIDDPIECSADERNYLLDLYNHYFSPKVEDKDVLRNFSGLRPLLGSDDKVSKASREYRIVRDGKLLTVFGGKWTTARALGRSVTSKIL